MAEATAPHGAETSNNGPMDASDPTQGHPRPVVFSPRGSHTHTFIMLHGRGDTARNFGPQFLVSEHSSGKILRDLFPGMKWIFPTAKSRLVAESNGYKMHQWFDIATLKNPSSRIELQLEGLRESCSLIRFLIAEEMKSIPCKNIILGGLSQGCATVLCTLLTFEPSRMEEREDTDALGAVIGMSGWLPLNKQIDEVLQQTAAPGGHNDPDDESDTAISQSTQPSRVIEAFNLVRNNMHSSSLDTDRPANLKVPIFLGHGTGDYVVEPHLGEEAASTMRDLGFDVTWKAYEDFHHWYKEPDEIDDMIEFLQEKTGLEIS